MTNRELVFTSEAGRQLRELEKSRRHSGLLTQIRKTLAFLETNLRHPSLRTHRYHSLRGPDGEEVFEAYVQNDTPAAYRIFFLFGPDRTTGRKRIPVLTIIAITSHP